MHKKELISKLVDFVADYNTTSEVTWKGQLPFVKFLIYYLTNLEIPADEKYDFWSLRQYLPQIMVDAFEDFRTNPSEEAEAFRQEWKQELGHDVPNIIDIGVSDVLNQSSAIQTTLGFMLKHALGDEWIEKNIDAYCNAQKYVIEQTFDKFLREVYRRGLGKIINDSRDRGMSGTFGVTELRSYVVAGRIMLTFARRIDPSKEGHYQNGDYWIINEHSISFVCEEDDPLCYSAGLQSVCADFRTCLDMIDDVILNWSAEAQQQKKQFAASQSVAMV